MTWCAGRWNRGPRPRRRAAPARTRRCRCGPAGRPGSRSGGRARARRARGGRRCRRRSAGRRGRVRPGRGGTRSSRWPPTRSRGCTGPTARTSRRASSCTGSPSCARPPGVSGSEVVAAAAIAPVGANVRPLRVSALRARWPRQRWSGKRPRASQCCQWCAVQTSRRYASCVGLREAAAPRQRAEAGLALLQQGPAAGAGSFQAEADIGGQGEGQVQALGLDDGLGVAVLGVPPPGVLAAVVEGGHAVQGELGLAVHAADRPQQHVLGVVVGRRPDVRAPVRMVVLPRPHDQAFPHHQPALAAVPAGLQHHRAGQVAPVAGHAHVVRAEPEPAGVPVQQRAEDARAVHPRQAHPLDRAARRHQRGDLAVGQERVVRDRRVRRELIEAAGRPLARAVGQRLERYVVLCCHCDPLSSRLASSRFGRDGVNWRRRKPSGAHGKIVS